MLAAEKAHRGLSQIEEGIGDALRIADQGLTINKVSITSDIKDNVVVNVTLKKGTLATTLESAVRSAYPDAMYPEKRSVMYNATEIARLTFRPFGGFKL
jgi:hypothetical protein